ncbi:hypothetical protein Focb16_v004350 [Fusarium oxysporum f. sp. cubense]|uniref:DUF2264 domain-containing protein n=1 Tax=Fusarium oxysporum f. sp. cubense TaxID=61366 RepID=A0A559KSC2_FUSOC|nr:hypothetical protein Focb16_v004350 [Fusarium oxysporum f. sp. cubense]
MPALSGFSDNPLITREDVVRASRALIAPLQPYFSPACARVRIPLTIGTHFDETAAQLEGFARPLFVVAALLHADEPVDDLLQPWIQGFVAGTDSQHAEYWGEISDKDQRMVEAEMIAFGLLAAPREILWGQFDQRTKTNVANWLRGLQGKDMHTSNWLWFRVMSNIALIKVCGADPRELQAQMDHDLETLDLMYLQDGWSSDGIWPEADDVFATDARVFEETGKRNQNFWSRQADYYSGSFAIQFSQLLYVKFASDLDPARAERYRQQARDFGSQFWRYFDESGAAIPFGRSLTYRFACAGFFAALAMAEVDNLPAPLDTPGAIKGHLLRHLRWWRDRSEDIFSSDGTINIGWLYPNMFLSEDYNSPQSVYWALKSFVVVALTADRPFWAEAEREYTKPSSGVLYLPAPRQILCNHPSGNHHFLLNPSQYLTRPFKNATAKFCKFAYSSAFTLSLAVGNSVASQLAPDNSLLLSRDGTETWATKKTCTDAVVSIAYVKGAKTEELTVASATWYPWADRQATVTTTLVPPSDRWPDWHLRVHRIKVNEALKALHTLEGGFAIAGRRQADTKLLPTVTLDQLGSAAQLGAAEGVFEREDSTVILSVAGASGVTTDEPTHNQRSTSVSVIKPEANTNLTAPRTLCPIIQHSVSNLPAGSEVTLVTSVFGISHEANGGRPLSGKSLLERWTDRPRLRFGDANKPEQGDYIKIDF